MFNYDAIFLGKKAEEMGFARDTLEKVTRLADILEYLNDNPKLKESLALKGGTAINLTIFNLPRLSVDIDMDYLINSSRDEMLEEREIVNGMIDRYMISQGYVRNPKTKFPHSLDSWVYDYMGLSGNRDNIKIEINYSLRAHVFPTEERAILPNNFFNNYIVNTLAPIEIFGSKINALLSRAAARDLYDVRNMIQHNIFKNTEETLLRKTVVFYAALSAKEVNKTFDQSAIDVITHRKVKTDLYPVIKRQERFDLVGTKELVREYLSDLMMLTSEEHEFLDRFEKGEYVPELLFDNQEILMRVKNHPMAEWKMRTKNNKL